MAKVDWDTNDYEEGRTGNFETLPKGLYMCMILESTVKETTQKTGKYFEFTFQVMHGKFKGRKLWARLNVHNRSVDAQRIGREQYNNLCIQAGVPGCKKTEQLHNRKVGCIVTVGKNNRDEPTNEIKGFMAYVKPEAGSEEDAAPPPARQQQERPPAQAGGGKPDDIDDDIPF